jgi:hypothetical protein
VLMRSKEKKERILPVDPVPRVRRKRSALPVLACLLLAMIMEKLTISSINCNSLNSSVSSRNNRDLKINGITKLKSNIIFLCDTRLSNKNLVSCENDIKKNLN